MKILVLEDNEHDAMELKVCVRCQKHDTHTFFLLVLENSGIITLK